MTSDESTDFTLMERSLEAINRNPLSSDAAHHIRSMWGPLNQWKGREATFKISLQLQRQQIILTWWAAWNWMDQTCHTALQTTLSSTTMEDAPWVIQLCYVIYSKITSSVSQWSLSPHGFLELGDNALSFHYVHKQTRGL